MSVDEALRRLAVAPKTGLEAVQAQRRAGQFGANRISPPPKRTLRKVIGWVFGGFGSLLLVASVICFIAWYGSFPLFVSPFLPNGSMRFCRKPLGNPDPQSSNLALAVVLLVVVFLQAAFNAWQDFSTSRVMASIQDMLPDDVTVLRDGVQTTLPAADLVPGDLVHVVMGQKVPADVKLIDVSGDLRFDRSVLTGEVCHDSRIHVLGPQLSLTIVVYFRASRSQDVWTRRMTTFSRYVVFRPGFPSSLMCAPPRQRTLLFKGHFASAGQASALSSKSATTPSCACLFLISS